MTSACILKDALRNHTQVFLKFRDSIFEICLHLINLNGTLDSLLSLMRSSGAGTSNETRSRKIDSHYPQYRSLYQSSSIEISCFDKNYSIYSFSFDMSSNISLDSTDSDVFYGEQLSDEPSPRRNNSPDVLNSTERSEHQAARMPSISTIASPQPHIFTINDDSNEPTIPYGFGWQLPIVPPSLNDLNLPPNSFNILATMAVAHQKQNTHDDNYSPQSPEPSELSSISTPPMNVSAFNNCETSYTSTDDNTFYTSDEPRRVY